MAGRMEGAEVSDLIERLTNASEGSRELDLAIAYESGLIHKSAGQFSCCCWNAGGDEVILTYADGKHGAYDGKEIARHSTSIDAARALVPDGHDITISQASGPNRTDWYATCIERKEYGNPIRPEGNAPTPALALCIASLKARALKSRERTE